MNGKYWSSTNNDGHVKSLDIDIKLLLCSQCPLQALLKLAQMVVDLKTIRKSRGGNDAQLCSIDNERRLGLMSRGEINTITFDVTRDANL
jgi:hypothetical protein